MLFGRSGHELQRFENVVFSINLYGICRCSVYGICRCSDNVFTAATYSILYKCIVKLNFQDAVICALSVQTTRNLLNRQACRFKF